LLQLYNKGRDTILGQQVEPFKAATTKKVIQEKNNESVFVSIKVFFSFPPFHLLFLLFDEKSVKKKFLGEVVHCGKNNSDKIFLNTFSPVGIGRSSSPLS